MTKYLRERHQIIKRRTLPVSEVLFWGSLSRGSVDSEPCWGRTLPVWRQVGSANSFVMRRQQKRQQVVVHLSKKGFLSSVTCFLQLDNLPWHLLCYYMWRISYMSTCWAISTPCFPPPTSPLPLSSSFRLYDHFFFNYYCGHILLSPSSVSFRWICLGMITWRKLQTINGF